MKLILLSNIHQKNNYFSLHEKKMYTQYTFLYAYRKTQTMQTLIYVWQKHREKYASSSRWNVRCLILDTRRDDTVHSYGYLEERKRKEYIASGFLAKERNIPTIGEMTPETITRVEQRTCATKLARHACRPDKIIRR